jgi:hypothetical protein
MALSDARRLIATDWVKADRRYVSPHGAHGTGRLLAAGAG